MSLFCVWTLKSWKMKFCAITTPSIDIRNLVKVVKNRCMSKMFAVTWLAMSKIWHAAEKYYDTINYKILLYKL